MSILSVRVTLGPTGFSVMFNSSVRLLTYMQRMKDQVEGKKWSFFIKIFTYF